MDPHPYRTVGRGERPGRGPWPDADVLIPLLVLSPAFLAVVVRAMVRGEALSAGATVCGAIVAATVGMSVSAWRARARQGRQP
jgi:hypothetical protein